MLFDHRGRELDADPARFGFIPSRPVAPHAPPALAGEPAVAAEAIGHVLPDLPELLEVEE